MKDKEVPEKELTDEEKLKILEDLAKKLIEGQKPLDPDFAKILDDHWWELF